MPTKIKTVLIASGSGTDAESIMKAYRNDSIKYAEIIALISTKENAGCLEKAKAYNVPSETIAYKKVPRAFSQLMLETLWGLEARLVFLVGCIHKIPVSNNFAMYNIHPADTVKYGGKRMYGLTVHEHVLEGVAHAIQCGQNPDSVFYTTPTIHRVTEEYDRGAAFLTANIRIPKNIVDEFISHKITLTAAAQMLQAYVLPFEWLMLPAAVDLAAQQILREEEA